MSTSGQRYLAYAAAAGVFSLAVGLARPAEAAEVKGFAPKRQPPAGATHSSASLAARNPLVRRIASLRESFAGKSRAAVERVKSTPLARKLHALYRARTPLHQTGVPEVGHAHHGLQRAVDGRHSAMRRPSRLLSATMRLLGTRPGRGLQQHSFRAFAYSILQHQQRLRIQGASYRERARDLAFRLAAPFQSRRSRMPEKSPELVLAEATHVDAHGTAPLARMSADLAASPDPAARNNPAMPSSISPSSSTIPSDQILGLQPAL